MSRVGTLLGALEGGGSGALGGLVSMSILTGFNKTQIESSSDLGQQIRR